MKISPFQLILMIIAGVALIVAVIMFAFVRTNTSETGAPVTMWGTIDSRDFSDLVSVLQQNGTDITNITYVQKSPETIENEFVSALAEGGGPDIIMLTQDQIIANENRITVIPYESYPLRTFKDTFIEEGELFTKDEGVIALPFVVDPLVMYWNRTTFSQNGISNVPKYWDEIMQLTPRLTVKDSSLNIQKSAVALGEFRNLDHAKEILLTLILQAGNPVIVRTTNDIDGNEYNIILSQRLGYTVAPTQAALNFFTQFANPSKDVYSWNRSLPRSQDRFIAGDLAMYFGFASEANTIREKNPNINFDVATIPQSRNGDLRKAFANMHSLAISRNSQNLQSAFESINILTSRDVQAYFIDITNLPPVRRDLLSADPEDPFESIFFTSALWADAILDVDDKETETILQSMVESVISGKLDTSEAIRRAEQEIIQLLFAE